MKKVLDTTPIKSSPENHFIFFAEFIINYNNLGSTVPDCMPHDFFVTNFLSTHMWLQEILLCSAHKKKFLCHLMIILKIHNV